MPLLFVLYIYIVIFLFGITVGSFVNVLIYRLPRELSVVCPPSSCPKCGARIRWYQNVPVFAWLFLGGRCRVCRESISVRYIIVELINGLAWALLFLHFGASWDFLAGILFFSAALAIFLIDIEFQIIPDSLNVFILAIGLASSWFRLGDGGLDGLFLSVVGMLAGGLFFFLVSLLGRLILRRDALGGGDVKLLAALGALLGPMPLIEVVFLSALLGSLVGFLLMLFGGVDREKRMIPYGPFIVAAALFSFVTQSALLDWYMRFL